MRPGATSMASKRISRMRSSAFRASQASAAAAMRRRWRSVTDHAASSSLSRALTSTNTNRLRRRAMMSISPTGLLQRRARMRKPLAMRNAAARLSAEIPVRNAIWRSGRGTWIGAARGRSSVMVALLGECKRALVDAAAGFSSDGGDFGDRLFDRKALERLTQQRVEIGRWQFSLPIGRRHHDHDLAARLLRLRRLARERAEVAALNLLVELGELAADGGLARSQLRGKIGERRRNARAGLEQDEGCGNALELVDARAPRSVLRRQESLEQEPVGGKAAQCKRCEYRRGSRQRGHARARRARVAHELVTGVGYERRPGVRDQRDRGILGEPGDELRPRLGGIVLVIGGERGGDAKMVEKLAGDARVLACDEVGGGEHLERPHGDVAQIADRSGDQIEAARKRRRAGRVAVEDVGASGAVAERARGCGGGCGRPHAPYSSGARLPRHGRRKKSLSFSFG